MCYDKINFTMISQNSKIINILILVTTTSPTLNKILYFLLLINIINLTKAVVQ